MAVSNFLNFSRAAEQLGLTQPAVSHQILQMEKDFGVPLFIRKKGDLIPINGDQDMALVTKEIMQKLGHEA